MTDSILFSFNVKLPSSDIEHKVDVVKRITPPKSKFNGQKIMHPFKTELKKEGKINNIHYTHEFASDEHQKLLSESTRFDIKHDGSCGALVWDGEKYIPYARFDIKKNKTGTFETPKTDTSKWIPCEQQPIDDLATHWPHFRPCSEDKNAYKWYIQAYIGASEFISKMTSDVYGDIVTIEYMGKKFNGKPSDPVEKEVGIVLHGLLGMNIPSELKNSNGFKAIFEALPVIEGLVAYPNETDPMKIRAEMFEGLSWGNSPPDFTIKYGHSGKGLSNEVII